MNEEKVPMGVLQPGSGVGPKNETPNRLFFIILPWLVLAVSLLMTFQLWKYKQLEAEQNLQSVFDFRIREVTSRIEQNIKAYQNALRGVQGVFVADQTVSRDEFSQYVTTIMLQGNLPGIQSIRFSPIVTKAEKESHIAAMHDEGFPEYTIKPEGQRAVYAPDIYIEPFTGRNLNAFGYDDYADQKRVAAMEKARDTDTVALSDKLQTVQDKDLHAEFVMYLPVYKYGAPHGTLAERRANIFGWIDFELRTQDLMASILGKHPADADIEIFDGSEISEDMLLYDSDDGERKTRFDPSATMFRNVKHIMLAGHTLTMESHSLPELEALLDKDTPRFFAIAGAGVSLLLTLLTWLLVHGRALALQSARRMNKELIRSDEALNQALNEIRAITEANPDMLYVVNTKGDLVRWSPNLENFLGFAQGQMMNRPVAELICEEDRPAAIKWIRDVFETGFSTMEGRFMRKDGVPVHFLCNGVVLKNSSGDVIGFTGTGRDISERKQTENIERMRNRVLELLANDAPLADILAQVALWVEAEDIRTRCSIVLFDDESKRLSLGAAPSLPDAYKAALEGGLTEEGKCICSVSAYRGERVVYENIPKQCSSVKNCPLAARGEVATCWSEPIKSPLGLVQGALTIYHMDAISLGDPEIKLVEHAANLASLAITDKQLKKELRLASLVLQHSSEGMLVTDADNRIIAVNPAFTKITGYSFEEVKGKDPKMFGSGRHDSAFFKKMWREINTTGHWQGELWDRRKDGELHVKWLTINTIRNEGGQVQRYVALFSDITEKKLSEELIWKQANFDALTELPNRRMFLDRLMQETKKSDRSGLPLTMFLIDLDQFKEVNDTLGHDVGDTLLQEAARRIRGCVRETDTVARLGGDEFTVILSELSDNGHVEDIAHKIIGKLADPFHLGNEVAYVSASIGITLYPNDASSIDALMKNADQAMYVAKSKGRNRFSYCTPALQEIAQTRLRLSNDLRGALAAREFRVYFQPIVELSTGRIHKAEALIRWQHATRGLVSPQQFIPLTEETGLIHDIGDWVFRESAHWAKHWSHQFAEDFKISVNMSPVQFRAEGKVFAAEWLLHLNKLGISGRNIVVEITEGLLLNAEPDIIDKLLVFRDAGIQVAIDDFGTGYSSLSYLKKFDIDYLKIDQSFVRNIETDKNDMALSEAIIVMAHKLGLKVIAEGVETEGQRKLLADAGCDYAQGYLFSHPILPAAFGAVKLLDFSGK